MGGRYRVLRGREVVEEVWDDDPVLLVLASMGLVPTSLLAGEMDMAELGVAVC